MARPEIKALKYFPLDANFFSDRKIRLLRGEHGADGIEIYLRLLTKCYMNEDNGYFLIWNAEEDYALMADETGYSKDKIRLVLSTCLRRSLFNDKLFEVGNVLTSRGIQRRYFSAIRETKIKAAAKGRYTFVEEDLCLLSEEDLFELNKDKLNKSRVWLKVVQKNDNSGINPDKSGINPSKSRINPAKESKVKESKVKEIKGDEKKVSADSVRLTDEQKHLLIKEYGEAAFFACFNNYERWKLDKKPSGGIDDFKTLSKIMCQDCRRKEEPKEAPSYDLDKFYLATMESYKSDGE